MTVSQEHGVVRRAGGQNSSQAMSTLGSRDPGAEGKLSFIFCHSLLNNVGSGGP